MGNCFCAPNSDDEDDRVVDEEGEDGEVIISQRYTYAKHRRSRFEHKRETDDPVSDSDENMRRLADEMQQESSKKKKRRSKKFEKNNSMLMDLLEGKKKKGFFSRKFAKLRGKNKKKDDDKEDKDKKEKDKKEKKDKKKEKKEKKKAIEMDKIKAKNKSKEATRQTMREVMKDTAKVEFKDDVAGEAQPKGEVSLRESINLRDSMSSITSSSSPPTVRKGRAVSLSDKMLNKQMAKYKERFGSVVIKQNTAPMESIEEL